MANLEVPIAIDLAQQKSELEEIKSIITTMDALKSLAKDKTRTLTAIYLKRTWTYNDLLRLAHRYVVLGRKHNQNIQAAEIWLNAEKGRLAELGLHL